MVLIKKAVSLLGYLILAMALMVSPPTSSYEEFSASESIPETSAAKQGTKTKLATRKQSTLLYKLVIFSKYLPILFVVLQMVLKQLPYPRITFKPYIFILLKRLFMTPIKFTSNFLAINTPIAV
ncbi:hypothetical protein [Paenibacillus agricola]|uniref:Uncharacterized protein n=1 Tax=Paenibacillus agricola TaxID=2716264 RepID=A0ABX0J9F3_9BACL|nr:hypothetical protein [Paenibacillus agricola]NHN32406.1 hypothetical protein [Paenibacillus agricola]